MQKSFLSKSLVGMALALIMAISSPIFAQRDAGAKMRGEFGVFGNSASRSMQNARAYYQDYRQYVQSAPAQKINPEVAKHVSDAIGDYIEKSQKHMAWMRKQAAGDKETLVSIDLIDKSRRAATRSLRTLAGVAIAVAVAMIGLSVFAGLQWQVARVQESEAIKQADAARTARDAAQLESARIAVSLAADMPARGRADQA